MSQTTPEPPTELAFEQGYERLQAIASRLNEEEVPVSEMCDLFAEGKGLELALTEFLDSQRQRVEAIERGEGIRSFRISRSPAPGAPEDRPQPEDFPGQSDFEPAASQVPPASPPSADAAGEGIPF